MNQATAFANIKRNIAIILSGNIGANILGLLSLSIFTYSQGAELFGYYVLVLTISEIASKLFLVDTWQSIIKFVPEFQAKNEESKLLGFLKLAFFLEGITLILLFGVLFFLSGHLLEFFSIKNEYHTELNMLLLAFVFNGFQLSTGVFRVYNRFAIQVKLLILTAVSKLIIFALLAVLNAEFKCYIYGTIFAQVLVFVVRMFFLSTLMSEKGIGLNKVFASKIKLKELSQYKVISFVVYNNFDISIRMFSRQFDNLVVGKLLGAEAVGLYRIAKEVANIISKLTDPIYQSIYPEFSHLLANKQHAAAKNVATKIAFYTGAAGLIFYIGFLVLGEWAIGLAFGQEFRPAYSITAVYFLAIFIAMVSLPLVPWMLAHGMAKQTFWNQFSATAAYCLILYPLVLYYSAIGAGIAYIIYYLIWVALALYSIRAIKES